MAPVLGVADQRLLDESVITRVAAIATASSAITIRTAPLLSRKSDTPHSG
jgi:hypothetical protein